MTRNTTQTQTQMKTWLLGMTVAVFVALAASAAQADTWRGTAPFCNGQCNPGETQVGTSNCGDGACCWSGQKVLCRNNQPTCAALETNTSCWGVVMICDNGHYEFINGQTTWVSCSKYACGACFGFPF